MLKTFESPSFLAGVLPWAVVLVTYLAGMLELWR